MPTTSCVTYFRTLLSQQALAFLGIQRHFLAIDTLDPAVRACLWDAGSPFFVACPLEQDCECQQFPTSTLDRSPESNISFSTRNEFTSCGMHLNTLVPHSPQLSGEPQDNDTAVRQASFTPLERQSAPCFDRPSLPEKTATTDGVTTTLSRIGNLFKQP